jgi:hypothetical protein
MDGQHPRVHPSAINIVSATRSATFGLVAVGRSVDQFIRRTYSCTPYETIPELSTVG